jgi:hypothetical protein
METPLALLEKELRQLETLMVLKFHHKQKREAKPLIPQYKDAIAVLKRGYCVCSEPDREAGYSYCYACNKLVSEERIAELIEIEAKSESGEDI